MSVIARSDDEIVAEVMDSIPQMKGWRGAKIGWRVWTQEAIRRTLAATNHQGAVEALRALHRTDPGRTLLACQEADPSGALVDAVAPPAVRYD